MKIGLTPIGTNPSTPPSLNPQTSSNPSAARDEANTGWWYEPIGSSKIGEAEMARDVRGELLHPGASGKLRDTLGPGPNREWFS